MEAIAWTITIIFCVVLMGWMVFFMGACIYFTLERARYYRTMRKYNKKHPDTPMIEFKKIKYKQDKYIPFKIEPMTEENQKELEEKLTEIAKGFKEE